MPLKLDIVVHASPADQALLATISSQLTRVLSTQEVLMGLQEDLDTATQKLVDAQAAEATRQQTQDDVTQKQITVLQQTVTDLQAQLASGAVDPTAAIAKINAVVDSLNAEQPTPPAV